MKQIVFMIILIISTMSSVLASTSCSEKPESVNIGGVPAAGSITIFIAEEKGFFSRNGLEVTLKSYNSGLAALDAVVKGEVELTPSGEFPIVGRAFQKEALSIIGVVAKTSVWYIIGLKDHGIENISDLKGKKVAIQRQSLGEFYLGRSLDLHNLSIADVTLVNTEPSQFIEVISGGSVDAVVVWDLYVNPVKERLGNIAVIWSAQENKPAFATISGRKDWVTQHPETVKRFLKALAQAEEYLISHQAEAKAILQKRLNYDSAYLDTIWPNYHFSLSLDLSLIAAMSDEARWMINNNLTSEKNAPDFYDYIYIDGLKAVKPGAVNISR